MNRFFVTGTDTGVGKTEVAAALLSLLADRGHRPFAFKPYESGVEVRGAPADAKRLQSAGGGWQSLDTVCLHRFKAPLAPAMAARKERRRNSYEQLMRSGFDLVMKHFDDFGDRALVVEGAGGLFVPLDEDHDVVHLIKRTGLPVVLTARAGLGTLNHVALSLEALARRKAEVVAVVLAQSTPGKDPAVAENLSWLRRRHPDVPCLGPVSFIADAGRRREAFRRALLPLL